MKTKILTAALLLSMTNVAHAGFFDSLFSTKEEAPVVAAPVKAEVLPIATSIDNSLLPTLTKQLGVTGTQAEGGMGSLMQLAQGQLSTDEFSQLSASVPNMDSLLSAAPVLSSENGGGVTDMLSNAGGMASSLGAMAKLTGQFQALGLSTDMIAQFAEIAISYFSQDGNKDTGALLQKGLGAILG